MIRICDSRGFSKSEVKIWGFVNDLDSILHPREFSFGNFHKKRNCYAGQRVKK